MGDRSERRRVRLTDQALVAVGVAREAAGEDRPASAADLLVGLAVEPSGVAGHVLREQPGTLRLHALAGPRPHLASLEAVVGAAADRADPRPPGTADLLAAALTSGEALLDILRAAGIDVEQLRERIGVGHRHPDSALARLVAGGVPPLVALQDPTSRGASWFLMLDAAWSEASETVGLRPETDPDPELTPAAALAVARTRALAGGAVELLLVLASADDTAVALPVDLWELADVVADLQASREPHREGWDQGLETVVEAARTWCAGRRVTPVDLIRAAAVAGGSGPAAVLEEAERRGRPEDGT